MSFDFNYYGDLEHFDGLLPVFAIFGSVILVAVILGSLFGFAVHVVRSLAIYYIGKRRGLKNPWLAWIPVGQEWIIGSLSDQYQYLTLGKNRNRRKILLILSLTATVIGWASTASGFSRIFYYLEAYGTHLPYEDITELIFPMTGTMLLGVLSSCVGVAAFVFRQISMYDLYRSCDPKNAIPYLVFGILFSILEPIFLMILRNRDDGMPPRKAAPEAPANEYL